MEMGGKQSGAKREQALHWRAVERELRAAGWSKREALVEVSRLKREQRGLWERIRG